jgi:hypothetical protein
MTNQRLCSWIVCGVLAVLLLAVAGCNDLGQPNDVTHAQEEMRMNRGVPDPTELPPGLGDDLPSASSTPPESTTP